MFRVLHDVRRQRVETEHISDDILLFAVNHFRLVPHISVDDFISRQEIVSDFLFRIVELDQVFAESFPKILETGVH